MRTLSTWANRQQCFALSIFKIGSRELFAKAGLELWSSWCQPPNSYDYRGELLVPGTRYSLKIRLWYCGQDNCELDIQALLHPSTGTNFVFLSQSLFLESQFIWSITPSIWARLDKRYLYKLINKIDEQHLCLFETHQRWHGDSSSALVVPSYFWFFMCKFSL
jgi:hypothetical protein